MLHINGYPLPDWILFFFIYCFLGWCIESTIVSVETKKLTNRGFLRGPMLPIYGFGALTIIFCTIPVRDNPILCYIMGVAACTVLEYVCAVIMESIFKTKYWDYSGQFMNFQGRICLRSSLFWGVLTLFVIKVIHVPISDFVVGRLGLAATSIIDGLLLIWLFADLYVSAKAAFDLNKVVARLEEVNVQLELAKMELKDTLAVKAEEAEQHVRELAERREAIRAEIGFAVRNLVRSNPTAVHKRFDRGLKDLKELLRK